MRQHGSSPAAWGLPWNQPNPPSRRMLTNQGVSPVRMLLCRDKVFFVDVKAGIRFDDVLAVRRHQPYSGQQVSALPSSAASQQQQQRQQQLPPQHNPFRAIAGHDAALIPPRKSLPIFTPPATRPLRTR